MTLPGLPPIGVSSQPNMGLTTPPPMQNAAPTFGAQPAASPKAGDSTKGNNAIAQKKNDTINLKSVEPGKYQVSVNAKDYEIVTGDKIKGLPPAAKDMVGLKNKKTGEAEFYLGSEGDQHLFAQVGKDGQPKPSGESALKSKETPGSKLDESA